MRLMSKNHYKSLEVFKDNLGLPDFVVISGLNGSGKSQLLEGISRQSIFVMEKNQALNPIKFVDHNSLNPQNGVLATSESIKQGPKALAEMYLQYKDMSRGNPSITAPEQYSPTAERLPLLKHIALKANKTINNLEAGDIFEYYPLDDKLNTTDIFQHDFSTLFMRYNEKWHNNKYKKFLNTQEGYDDIRYLSEERFLQEHGEPPWDTLNRIIQEAQLDYYANSPGRQDPDTPFGIKLSSF